MSRRPAYLASIREDRPHVSAAVLRPRLGAIDFQPGPAPEPTQPAAFLIGDGPDAGFLLLDENTYLAIGD